MKGFYENKSFIWNEFEKPSYNEQTGLSASVLAERFLQKVAEFESLPPAIARAESFAWVINNAQIEVNTHTPFADKVNLGISYSGWAGTSFYEDYYATNIRRAFAKRIPEAWQERFMLANSGISCPDNDYWHTFPDWNNVLRLGLTGLKARAEEKLIVEKDKSKADFYRSIVIYYDAVLSYVKRLKEEAERVGNSVFAKCMENLSVAPPKTLYEAMELSLLYMNMEEIGKERCRTLGNIDLLLAPFYRKGIADGTYSDDDVKELFRYFIAKINAGKRFAEQPLCIGGYDLNGESAVSGFTDLFIDVYRELGVYNPKIHVRYNSKFPDSTLYKIVDAIRAGSSSMVIINDRSVIDAYGKIGISKEVAMHYVPQGCYEPTIMGVEDARICGAWINVAKAVELAVHGGHDAINDAVLFFESNPEPDDFAGFYDIFKKYLFAFVDVTMRNIEAQEASGRDIYPSPFLSATFDSCVKNGRDLFDRGVDVRNNSIKVIAVGTAVDSLITVKTLVYDQKRYTLRQFSRILRNNWKGFEELRTEVLKDKRKWGNGDDEADAFGKEIYDYCAQLIVGKSNNYGGVYRLGADSVASNDNLGRNTGATPDGRGERQSLSKNMRPVTGMDREGVTAFMRSMLAVDQSVFSDGAPLDFIVHPSAVSGEKGLKVFAEVIKTYFKCGGQAIHGNVVCAETLEDAVKNPEKYKNLQIRVCGWNEFFVDMSKSMQLEFIKRAKGAEQ